MCGIVGYIGSRPAAPILLNGLSKLEYRGYDSAGIAVYNGEQIVMEKVTGRLNRLRELTRDGETLPGLSGIGHTRWATHGSPSDVNAHPHFNRDGSIVVVHNGIIENYAKLKQTLIGRGYEFLSETDTEVLAHLLDYYYKGKCAGNPLAALTKVMQKVEGSYALGILFRDFPEQIFAARKDSPLIVGGSEEGNFIASDVPAILQYTRSVYYMENEEIAVLSREGIRFFNMDEEELSKEPVTIEWDIDAAEKGGYEHFMLKEIYEQPKAVRDTLTPRIRDGRVVIEELGMTDEEIARIRKIMIVACGSAYHTGVTAKYVFEGISRIPVEVDLASEFRYRNPIITPSTLVVAVSQSGETADTLAAIRDARVKGAKVFGITNVVGSPVARESDGVIYTKANKEIAVASTKSFLGQVVSLTLLAMLLAQVKGKLKTNQVRLLFHELADTAEQVERILADSSSIDEAACACKDAASALFVGRGMGAAIACEGALKLKEISYLHAEAYPAGEMKHGPIALIDEGFPVIAVVTKSPVYDKLVSNLQEAKARGAMVVAIATEGDNDIKHHADHVIYIPKVRDAFSAITASVPLQLFARAIAVERGCDVDQPRNLAKSVTVE